MKGEIFRLELRETIVKRKSGVQKFLLKSISAQKMCVCVCVCPCVRVCAFQLHFLVARSAIDLVGVLFFFTDFSFI